MAHRSGFTAVIGRPNVGKSTLINALTGEKVAITSPKPQTTRTNLRAIITEEDYQIIFIDTPGIHRPRTKLGEYMVRSAKDVIGDADVILYLFDSTDDEVTEADREILAGLKEKKAKGVPVILILTKIDLIQKEKLLELTDKLTKEMDFTDIIPVSAKKKDGIKIIIDEIVKRLPEGPEYYPDDIITDSTVREMAAEIIREKILLYTNEEVPHGTGVEIIIFEEPARKKDVCTIEANIYCEKESHKGILIGKNGAMLKKIGTAARYDIEKIQGSPVNLKLWVKVKTDWRNSPGMLKELGYREDKKN